MPTLYTREQELIDITRFLGDAPVVLGMVLNRAKLEAYIGRDIPFEVKSCRCFFILLFLSNIVAPSLR